MCIMGPVFVSAHTLLLEHSMVSLKTNQLLAHSKWLHDPKQYLIFTLHFNTGEWKGTSLNFFLLVSYWISCFPQFSGQAWFLMLTFPNKSAAECPHFVWQHALNARWAICEMKLFYKPFTAISKYILRSS